jgi:hypothetical protein
MYGTPNGFFFFASQTQWPVVLNAQANSSLNSILKTIGISKMRGQDGIHV